MICKKCGKEIMGSTLDTNGMCCECFCNPVIPSGIFGTTGWICPICGLGLSPYTQICPCHKNALKITSTGLIDRRIDK